MAPRSKRPVTVPTRASEDLEHEIVLLRKQLVEQGFDAGAQTIHHPLGLRHDTVPSVSTIWRVLKRRGFVVTEPHTASHIVDQVRGSRLSCRFGTSAKVIGTAGTAEAPGIVYISVHPDSKEGADRIFGALSEGAEIEMAMADQALGRLLRQPEGQVRNRVDGRSTVHRNGESWESCREGGCEPTFGYEASSGRSIFDQFRPK